MGGNIAEATCDRYPQLGPRIRLGRDVRTSVATPLHAQDWNWHRHNNIPQRVMVPYSIVLRLRVGAD